MWRKFFRMMNFSFFIGLIGQRAGTSCQKIQKVFKAILWWKHWILTFLVFTLTYDNKISLNAVIFNSFLMFSKMWPIWFQKRGGHTNDEPKIEPAHNVMNNTENLKIQNTTYRRDSRMLCEDAQIDTFLVPFWVPAAAVARPTIPQLIK